ncbi:MAG: DUF3822 family protein [Haliscomenobacter sp.]|nr:DUF3822 family protein [Haliscomenobacter sp.]
MGITTFDIQEDFFSSSQTATGKLSILLGMDSFCYCIADQRNRIAFLRRIQGDGMDLDLESVSRDNPYLFFPFAQTAAVLAIPKHVWVPGRLFNPAEKTAYVKHGNDLIPGTPVFAEEVSDQHAHLVYPVPIAMAGWLDRHFSKASRRHFSAALMRALSPVQQGEGPYVLAHFSEKALWVTFWEGERLQFGNSFECKDLKDYLYFLLLVVRQFGLLQEEIPVYLSGGLAVKSELYGLLRHYFSRLAFVEVGGPWQLGPRLGEYPRHFYNDLLAGLMPER